MKQFHATISDIQSLAPDLRLFILTAPELPHFHAGQLLLARAPGRLDPYLRSAYFPVPAPGSCSIIVGREAPPESLSLGPAGAVGDTLDLLAPIGHGFALDASTRRLLLVGDESHIAPLIALAHEATRKQIAVTFLIHDSRDAPVGRLPPRRLYEALLPLDVEYQFVVQMDLGTDLLRWCDQLCAAGSPTLYAFLKERIIQTAVVHASDFAQVVVTPPMPCGSGACLGCAVETTRRVRLACVDGPVFDLMQLVL